MTMMTGQGRTVKKLHKMVIFSLFGEVPTVPIKSKICIVDGLPYVITCAKFQVEIFRG